MMWQRLLWVHFARARKEKCWRIKDYLASFRNFRNLAERAVFLISGPWRSPSKLQSDDETNDADRGLDKGLASRGSGGDVKHRPDYGRSSGQNQNFGDRDPLHLSIKPASALGFGTFRNHLFHLRKALKSKDLLALFFHFRARAICASSREIRPVSLFANITFGYSPLHVFPSRREIAMVARCRPCFPPPRPPTAGG